MSSSILNNATSFGSALDKDDFEAAKKFLHKDCVYEMGERKFIGRDEIHKAYENNMKEGRAKFDSLEWGDCRCEQISDTECHVHFTDYLGHKGIEHIYKCKQKLSFNPEGEIVKILHVPDEREQQKLEAYLKMVGLDG